MNIVWTYLIIGFIVSLVWKAKYRIPDPKPSIPAILGSLVGQALTILIWPIAVIRLCK